MTSPKIITQVPQWDSGGIYNREVVFRLEQYGLVKMIFLIFEVTFQAGSTVPSPTTPYLISDVALESFGNPIAHVTTSYTLGRMDELDTDLYNQVLASSTISGPFGTAKTASLPLFFWAIDNQRIDTFKYPNLTIRCRTKSSAAAMGVSLDLSAMNIKMNVLYDQKRAVDYVPVSLENPYNVYRIIKRNLPVSVVNTEYTAQVKINVPFEVSNMYLMLRKASNAITKGVIHSVKLSTPTHVIGTFSSITNYFLNERNSANSGNTFAVQLANRRKKRDDYLTFNGTENPTLAEITYSCSVAEPFDLYIALEYYSTVVFKDDMLVEEVSRSFVEG